MAGSAEALLQQTFLEQAKGDCLVPCGLHGSHDHAITHDTRLCITDAGFLQASETANSSTSTSTSASQHAANNSYCAMPCYAMLVTTIEAIERDIVQPAALESDIDMATSQD